MCDKFYGYDMNGERITESTVDEFYRIAEYEFAEKYRKNTIFSGITIVNEDFEYFNTGTVFGALMNYTIIVSIDSRLLFNKNLTAYDILKMSEATSIPAFDDSTFFNIDLFVYVKSSEIKRIVIDDTSVYSFKTFGYPAYSEYDSKKVKEIVNEIAIEQIVHELLDPLVYEITSFCSNI
jgi:hypothetical protein